MLRQLGFILDFRNKASKGLKDVAKDMGGLDDAMEEVAKENKSWTKVLAEGYQKVTSRVGKLEADTGRAFRGMREHPRFVAEAVDRLDDAMGTSIGNIVRTLGRPEVAFGSMIAGFVASASAMEKAGKKVQRVMTPANFALEDYQGHIARISSDLGLWPSEVGAAMASVASRIPKGSKFIVGLTESTLQMAEAMRVSKEASALWGTELFDKSHMSLMEITKLNKAIVGAAKAGKFSGTEMLSNLSRLVPFFTRFEGSHEKFLTSSAEVLGAVGHQVEGFPNLMRTVLDNITHLSKSPQWAQTATMFSGIADPEKVRKMVTSGKFVEVFKILSQAAKKVIDEQGGVLQPLASIWQQMLGLDPAQIRQIGTMNLSNLPSVQKEMGRAQEPGYLRQMILDNRTTWEEFKVQGMKLMVAIEPLGKDLLAWGRDFLHYLNTLGIKKFISDNVNELRNIVLALGAATLGMALRKALIGAGVIAAGGMSAGTAMAAGAGGTAGVGWFARMMGKGGGAVGTAGRMAPGVAGGGLAAAGGLGTALGLGGLMTMGAIAAKSVYDMVVDPHPAATSMWTEFKDAFGKGKYKKAAKAGALSGLMLLPRFMEAVSNTIGDLETSITGKPSKWSVSRRPLSKNPSPLEIQSWKDSMSMSGLNFNLKPGAFPPGGSEAESQRRSGTDAWLKSLHMNEDELRRMLQGGLTETLHKMLYRENPSAYAAKYGTSSAIGLDLGKVVNEAIDRLIEYDKSKKDPKSSPLNLTGFGSFLENYSR
jgi:hypothetical protein